MILMNAITLGVPQWMVEEGAMDFVDITNEAGAIIPVKPGMLAAGAVQRLDPRQSPDDLYANLRDLQTHAQEDIGDLTEAIQGKAVTSNASGVLQNSALGAALTEKGFQAQMMDHGHQRAATIETSMVQQFMTIDTQTLLQDKERGELLEMNLAIRELFYDVKVESNADLPHNPIARIEFATSMLSLGIFDVKEFVLFLGLHPRPELMMQLEQASEFFMPAIPHEQQSQIRLELEMAKMRMQEAQAGIPAEGGAPAGGGGESIGTQAPPVGRTSGETVSGGGTAAAGNPNQRPL